MSNTPGVTPDNGGLPFIPAPDINTVGYEHTWTGGTGPGGLGAVTENTSTDGRQYTGTFDPLAGNVGKTANDLLNYYNGNNAVPNVPGAVGNATQRADQIAGGGYNGAAGYLGQLGGYQQGDISQWMGNLGDVNVGQVGTDLWSSTAMNQYMNPYLAQVYGSTMSDLQRRQAEERAALDASSAKNRSFGSRSDVARATVQDSQSRAATAASADLLSKGYDTAFQQFTSDQTRSLDAAKSNQNADIAREQIEQGNAKIGIDATQTADRNKMDQLTAAIQGSLDLTKTQLSAQQIAQQLAIGEFDTVAKALNMPIERLQALAGILQYGTTKSTKGSTTKEYESKETIINRDQTRSEDQDIPDWVKDVKPGSPGTPGTPGKEGSDGSDGKEGADGDDGKEGSDGKDGATPGTTPGTPGTPVTPTDPRPGTPTNPNPNPGGGTPTNPNPNPGGGGTNPTNPNPNPGTGGSGPKNPLPPGTPEPTRPPSVPADWIWDPEKGGWTGTNPETGNESVVDGDGVRWEKDETGDWKPQVPTPTPNPNPDPDAPEEPAEPEPEDDRYDYEKDYSSQLPVGTDGKWAWNPETLSGWQPSLKNSAGDSISNSNFPDMAEAAKHYINHALSAVDPRSIRYDGTTTTGQAGANNSGYRINTAANGTMSMSFNAPPFYGKAKNAQGNLYNAVYDGGVDLYYDQVTGRVMGRTRPSSYHQSGYATFEVPKELQSIFYSTMQSFEAQKKVQPPSPTSPGGGSQGAGGYADGGVIDAMLSKYGPTPSQADGLIGYADGGVIADRYLFGPGAGFATLSMPMGLSKAQGAIDGDLSNPVLAGSGGLAELGLGEAVNQVRASGEIEVPEDVLSRYLDKPVVKAPSGLEDMFLGADELFGFADQFMDGARDANDELGAINLENFEFDPLANQYSALEGSDSQRWDALMNQLAYHPNQALAAIGKGYQAQLARDYGIAKDRFSREKDIADTDRLRLDGMADNYADLTGKASTLAKSAYELELARKTLPNTLATANAERAYKEAQAAGELGKERRADELHPGALLAAEADLQGTIASTSKTVGETEKLGLDNLITASSVEDLMARAGLENDLTRAQTESAVASTAGQNLENNYLDATLDERVRTPGLENDKLQLDSQGQALLNKYGIETLPDRISQTGAEARSAVSQATVDEATETERVRSAGLQNDMTETNVDAIGQQAAESRNRVEAENEMRPHALAKAEGEAAYWQGRPAAEQAKADQAMQRLLANPNAMIGPSGKTNKTNSADMDSARSGVAKMASLNQVVQLTMRAEEDGVNLPGFSSVSDAGYAALAAWDGLAGAFGAAPSESRALRAEAERLAAAAMLRPPEEAGTGQVTEMERIMYANSEAALPSGNPVAIRAAARMQLLVRGVQEDLLREYQDGGGAANGVAFVDYVNERTRDLVAAMSQTDGQAIGKFRQDLAARVGSQNVAAEERRVHSALRDRLASDDLTQQRQAAQAYVRTFGLQAYATAMDDIAKERATAGYADGGEVLLSRYGGRAA